MKRIVTAMAAAALAMSATSALAQGKPPLKLGGILDTCKLLATISGNEAIQPLETSRCPLVKK